MIKQCIICGASFRAAPSDKKVTCSPECRSIRAAHAARAGGKPWNEQARKRRAEDPKIRAHMDALQKVGHKAAMALPESQRGPQHRGSKVWELIDPVGNHITVTNLRDWARSNYTIFEPDCTDVDKAARRVYDILPGLKSEAS